MAGLKRNGWQISAEYTIFLSEFFKKEKIDINSVNLMLKKRNDNFIKTVVSDSMKI